MARVEVATAVAVPSNPRGFVRPDNEHFITSLKRTGCTSQTAAGAKRIKLSDTTAKPVAPEDQENKEQVELEAAKPDTALRCNGGVFQRVFQFLQKPSSGNGDAPENERTRAGDVCLAPAAALSGAETDSSVELECLECTSDSRALSVGNPADDLSASVSALEHAVIEIQSTAYPLAEISTEDEENEEEMNEFDPFFFIKSLPTLEKCTPKHRVQLLPRQTRACKQKTLVLDLDETLVHSSLDFVPFPDFSFPVQFNNQEHIVNVKQRPHLATFMQRVSELFEVVVFTASQRIYAEKLLNILDPERKLIRHRIYRDSCVYVEGNYLKDLSVLGRNLAHTLIIDNSPQAFGFQLENGVPIESWYEDDNDCELLNMLPFLESLATVDDVRPVISQRFRLHERVLLSA